MVKSLQLQMLTDMHTVIKTNQSQSDEQAFESLIQFLAMRLLAEENISTEWTKKDTLLQLHDLFDLPLLQDNRWDWIGELHHTLRLNLIKTKYYISLSDVIKKSQIDTEVSNMRMLDPMAATGRNILMYSQIAPTSFFYAASSDLLAYRIMLLNMKIYDIRSSVLLADAKQYDLREFSPNWRYANMWNPVAEKKFLTEEETDARVSIAEDGTYNFL